MLMPVAFTFAHCPLCTAGAGVGVLIAKELGMKSSAIGVWVGAFSVALGLWVWNMIIEKQLKKRATSASEIRVGSGRMFEPKRSGGQTGASSESSCELLKNLLINFSKPLLILISFLSIILPLKLYFYEIGAFSIFWFGDYGSLFNRTYVYDKFLFGSIIGGLVILISPLISKKIIELRRGKIFPYQGLLITFILLILISILFQSK